MHAWVLICFSHVRLFATLWTVVCQAALSMEFSRQEYWSGLPRSSRGSSRPRDQTDISCVSCIAGGFFTTEPLGKSCWFVINVLYYVEMCSLYTCFECFYHDVVKFCLQCFVLCTDNNLSYLFYAYNLQFPISNFDSLSTFRTISLSTCEMCLVI